MLFFLLVPLVLFFCLPKRVQDEVADWARMLVGTLVVLSVVIWLISIVWQILSGTPAVSFGDLPDF